MLRLRRALLLFSVTSASALTLGAAAAPLRATGPSPIEALVAACPSAADVATFEAAVSLRFEGDPTAAGTVECTAAQSGRNLTLMQARVYRALEVMRSLRYSHPLPWTTLSLYDWFVQAISGVRLRTDIGTISYCCDPPRTIDIAATASVLGDPKGAHPGFNNNETNGVLVLVDLLAHEARHAEGKPHTCGSSDQTIEEQGATTVQAEVALWTALYSDSFLDGPNPQSNYRDAELTRGSGMLHSICGLASADLTLTIKASPQLVARSGLVTFASTVANKGPGSAPAVILIEKVPDGVALVSATPSQGTCALQAGRTVCEFGTVAAGAAATASIVYRITTATGIVLYPSRYAAATILAQVNDPSPINDHATAQFAVAPATAGTTKLTAAVGPGSTISLRAADGKTLSGRKHGVFSIVVNDRSATDNFHLVGPGLSKATGVAFKGSVTWKLTLKAGSYTFKSDKHAALHGAFKLK